MPPGHRPRPGEPSPVRPRHVEETSAGGLVVDPGNGRPRAALIGRWGRTGDVLWALPKGHVELGESLEEAAVREIAEETGIRGRLIRPLGIIDYRFFFAQQQIHKTVHHFVLLATGGQLSTADIEVDDVAWVPLDEIPGRLAHDNERELVAGDADLMAGMT